MQVKSKMSLLAIFLFILVISISSVSAQELDESNNDLSIDDEDTVSIENPDDGFVDDNLAVEENNDCLSDPPKADSTFDGVVSGDVDVVTVGPWENKSAELNYEIPADAKDIKNAIVYVNIYSGSATNTNWALDSNTSITTINGNVNLGYEKLWTEQCSLDNTPYTVNDHVTRVASDYQLIYNVTNIVKGLNGTSISIHVDSINNTNYTFDGRIKLLGLLLAYDDGDEDIIKYWVDANQRYTKQNISLEFNTDSLDNVIQAVWTNVVLSSTDASYKINNNPLGDPDKHVDAGNYKYNKWTVTEKVIPSTNTTMTFSNNGYSAKSVLSVLTVNEIQASATVKVADYTKNIIYPGFDNRFEVNVKTNKPGNYTINLLDGEKIVNSTEFELTGDNTIYLIDPTIRDVNESSEYVGASGSYDKVNYKVELLFNNVLVNDSSCQATILYNGYLGKDTYNQNSFESNYTITINGDIVILTNGTYAGSTATYQPVNYDISLPDSSNVVKAFVYVTYCWAKNADDNIAMFNATLNGNNLTPIFFTRDQSNLESLYGYGVVIYDATGYVINGTNELSVVRNIESVAIYPSTLIYMYNTTGSEIVKEVYISNGADLLGTSGGISHPVCVNSTITVDANDVKDATAYIFANGAKDGKAVVVINGVSDEHPWNGDSYSTDLYTKDITSTIKENNEISVFLNPNEKITITALQQIIVLTKDAPKANISEFKVADYTKNIIYPGFDNALSFKVNTNRAGKYIINLLDGDKIVNTTEVTLINGENPLTIIDPTSREVNESSEYVGASGSYDKVNYKLELLFKNALLNDSSCQATILYNGYLGKDTYNQNSFESNYTITINGDIVILTNGTYAGSTAVYKPVNYTVELPDSSNVVKAFVYVTYCWAKNADDNIAMFNATLNGNNLTPIFFTRDQSNLESLYGYGVVIYDATGYVINGTNELSVVRNIESVAIYPSTLIYMYNTTGSEIVKEVYISNGADLLGTSGGISHPVCVNSTITVDANDVKDATAYIFANGATDGKAVVVINGVSDEHPWNGDSYSTDLYTKDITSTIKDNNEISVFLNPLSKITITALQQIIVITKKTTVPADEAFNVNNPADTKTPTYSINLPKGATGTFTVTVDGKVYETKDLVDGSASITVKNLAAGNHNIVVSYSGDGNYSPVSKGVSVNIKGDDKPVTPKVTKKATKIVASKKTFKAKVKVKKYTVTLKSGKKPVKKVWLTLKIKNKTFKAKTNNKGKAIFKIKKLTKKGKYTATIKFKGNSNYKAYTKKVKITVKK